METDTLTLRITRTCVWFDLRGVPYVERLTWPLIHEYAHMINITACMHAHTNRDPLSFVLSLQLQAMTHRWNTVDLFFICFTWKHYDKNIFMAGFQVFYFCPWSMIGTRYTHILKNQAPAATWIAVNMSHTSLASSSLPYPWTLPPYNKSPKHNTQHPKIPVLTAVINAFLNILAFFPKNHRRKCGQASEQLFKSDLM